VRAAGQRPPAEPSGWPYEILLRVLVREKLPIHARVAAARANAFCALVLRLQVRSLRLRTRERGHLRQLAVDSRERGECSLARARVSLDAQHALHAGLVASLQLLFALKYVRSRLVIRKAVLTSCETTAPRSVS
jgi:hypothetical protein